MHGYPTKMNKSKLTLPEENGVYPTEREMPEGQRAEVSRLLNLRLSDTLDLRMQLQQAQWNLRGPEFVTLQMLFDTVDRDLGFYVDMLVERIIQLGGTVEATVHVTASRTSIPEYLPPPTEKRDPIGAVSHALARFGDAARTSILSAQSLGDCDSADLVRSISRGVDRCLGMFESQRGGEPNQ